MQPARKSSPPEVFLKEHLLYVITKAEAGEYADAMAALQETLQSAKDNIYVRAVERQLTSLLDLSRRNALTDERKTEILDPISSIVEKAISALQSGQGSIARNYRANETSLGSTLSLQEKAAALDKLKVNYFERASQHLSEGDYPMALTEIRRVFVIEPDNPTAKQYESVILELMNLKGKSVMQPTISARSAVPPPIARRAPIIPLPQRRTIEPVTPLRGIDVPSRAVTAEEDDIQVETPLAPAEPVVLPEPQQTAIPEPPIPVTAEDAVPTSDTDSVFTVDPAPPARPASKRSRRIAVIAAAVILVGGTLAAFEFLKGPGESGGNTTDAISTSSTPSDKGAETAEAVVPSNSEQQGGLRHAAEAASVKKTGGKNPSPSVNAQPEEKPAPPEPVKPDLPVIHTDDISPVTDEAAPAPSAAASSSQEESHGATQETAGISVTDPSPDAFVAYEKEPQVVKLSPPTIPDNAWGGATVKQLVVRVMINAEGKPEKVIFLKGDTQPVENAVADAMMKSTFTPGIMGKAAVVTWLTIPINIRRED